MVNYPGRQNFPKFLEDGWDRTDDESVSLPIVWELEKIGADDVGLWTALKYEKLDGTSYVVQNTDEGINLVSETIPDIMNIDELTIGGKDVKICDVYNYDALKENNGDYEKNVRYTGEWRNWYYEPIKELSIFDYELDDENAVAKIKGILDSVLIGNIQLNIFEMADMMRSDVKVYWIDWSEFDFSTLSLLTSVDTIRLPYRAYNFNISGLTKPYNVILLRPEQYHSIKDANIDGLYTSFNWNYRYAIDFEKYDGEVSENAHVYLPDLLTMDYKRIDLVGGSSYQFDRTSDNMIVDLGYYDSNFWNYRRFGRLEVNIYSGKLAEDIFITAQRDGTVRDYLLDFNVFGVEYDDLSDEAKETVEYLKEYHNCEFYFLPQPIEKNTKDYEKIENMGYVGVITEIAPSTDKQFSILKTPNIFGESVMKDEYMLGESVIEGKDFIANGVSSEYNHLGDGPLPVAPVDTQKLIIENGVSAVKGVNTFYGMQELRNIKCNNSQLAFSEYADKTFNGTGLLGKIDNADTLDVYMDAGFTNSGIYLDEVKSIYENIGPAVLDNCFRGTNNIKKVVIDAKNATSISLNYAFAYSNIDEVVFELPENFDYSNENNVFTNFVSNNCHMTFTVDTYEQKGQLEAIIMDVLGIESMADTDIKVVSNEKAWDVSTLGDGSVIATLNGDTLTISGNGVMKDYSKVEDTPYYGYIWDIANVKVLDGVTSVGKYAFRKSNILSVELADSVETIGSYSFRDCYNLETINFPSGLKTIGSNAFNGDSKLASEIALPEECVYVGGAAFRNCSSVESIVISSANARLYSGKNFDGCTNVNYFEWTAYPADVDIYDSAFMNMGSEVAEGLEKIAVIDTRNTELTATLKALGYTIEDPNIEEWDVSDSTEDSVTASYNKASKTMTIYGTGKMKNYAATNRPYKSFVGEIETAVVEDGVTRVGNYAFQNTTKLSSLTLGKDVESVGAACFQKTIISSVELPDGLKTIGSNAFNNITTLTGITIPASVVTIGSGAFISCASLSSLIIEEGSQLESIEANAFKECKALTSINIPDGVKTVKGGAFNGCIGLTSIELPNSIESILGSVFLNCSNVETFVCGAYPVSIYGETTFQGMGSSVTGTKTATIDTRNEDMKNYLETLGYIINDINIETIDLSMMQDGSVIASYNKSTGEIIVSGQEIAIGVFSSIPESWGSATKLTVEDGITGIDSLFNEIDGLTNFTEITLADSVESINLGAYSSISDNYYVSTFTATGYPLNIGSGCLNNMGRDVEGEKTATIDGRNTALKTKLESLGYAINDINHTTYDLSANNDGSIVAKYYPSSKKMVISGSGEMMSNFTYTYPYDEIKADVETVIVESDVTSYANGEFAGFVNTKDIIFKASTTVSSFQGWSIYGSGDTLIGSSVSEDIEKTSTFYVDDINTSVISPNGFKVIVISQTDVSANEDGSIIMTEEKVGASYNPENYSVTISGVGDIKDGSLISTSDAYFLKNILINNGITKIGAQNFGNNGVTNIKIANTVTEIGSNAFNGCIYVENFEWNAYPVEFVEGVNATFGSSSSGMGSSVAGIKTAIIDTRNTALVDTLTALGYTIVDASTVEN